ncbi:hypothetical protein [Methylocystis echinoides]|uniref:hypothetical protein n=1 Tax=Methylocystis echinoides TaxID=29468 RepID=UPI00344798C4
MSFVVDPRFIDAILALVALEAVGVLGLRWSRVSGPEPLGFLCTLSAGAFLLLALRNALAGASTFAIAASLVLALASHLADLWLRWRSSSETAAQSTIGKQTAIAQARPKAAPSAPGRGSRVRA